MQIVHRTGLLGILILLAWPVWAAEDEASVTPDEPVIHSESGHVVGFSPLTVGDNELPATLIPEQLGEPHGKVLILHDSDGGIAGAGLVDMLRLALPESGWTTMTVALDYPRSPQLFLAEPNDDAETIDIPEMPETADEAMQADASEQSEESAEPADNDARISAALAYLNAQQTGPTVILALGEAVPLAMNAAAQQGENRPQIWIAADVTLTELPELGPLLDITAQTAGRKNLVAMGRKVFMRQAGNQTYSQRQLTGAGRDFQGFEGQVLSHVRAWLHKQFTTEVKG